MEFETLKDKTLDELYQLLEEQKKAQLDLRVQIGAMPEEVKPHRIRELRRDVAKIMTRMRQLKVAKGA